jgi:hypothetical protein
MTLLETERLVRKLAELLQQPGDTGIAPKLAEDYAFVCRATNLRLQQCEAMIKAGDRHQAIQLAETAPNLLDLVTILEFRGSDEWRAYCQQNTLSAAERIDARSVHALNDCYAQGITTDHPLYAIYRRAVLSRNDDEALKALQSITRLNPGDVNAASELTRLDAKVLATKVEHLRNSLEGADPALLVAEIEDIEAFGFKSKPEEEVWRKAQAIRCGYLLEEAGQFKSSSDWIGALGKVDFIHRLQDEFKIELSSALLKQLDILETWTHVEQEKDKQEREFNSLLGELHHRIHQSEEKDTSARYVKLPELRDDYEALHKVWRSLTDFTRPIPENAASSFRKRSALLEAELARRTAIRRRLIITGSAMVLLAGGVIAWLAIGQMKARDFTKQLREAISQRQVGAADKLLEQGRSQKIGDASALADAETFVAKEHALLANFEAAFAKLPQQLSGETDASRMAGIANQLDIVRNSFNALAPELKTENEPRLQSFEKQWQNYLSESGRTVNELFEQWVSLAEKQCLELDYRANLEKATTQINDLGSLVRKISDCEAGFTNHLDLRNDLLQRSTSVQAKFAAYDRELEKIDTGMAAIRNAHTLKDFADGISLVASSEFSGSPPATAAYLVQSLNADDEATLRYLLGTTDAGTWAFVRNTKFVRFVPEVVMPAEHQILQQLNDDPAVNANHQRYRLWLDPEKTKNVEWITTGGLATSTGWTTIMAWTFSGSATSATFEDHNYGFFDGQYRLTPTEPVYSVDMLGSTGEAGSYNSVGLQQVWAGNDSYLNPLLAVLDSIKDSREDSPLFRAYLFLRLAELMKFQPDAWGITFCPTLRRNEAQIRSLVSEQFRSGDWFVPAKVDALSNKLNQFFASVNSVSYEKQAEGLLAIARATSNDGLRYVGFVGLDGKPNYVDNSNSGEVWGYTIANKQPVLQAESIEVNKPLNIPGMPLSPLFALASPRKEYLARTGVNPGDASFQRALPPLFQELTHP